MDIKDQPAWPGWHLWNTSPNNRIHVILKGTWNIYKDISGDKDILDHKINFDKFKVTEIIRSIFFDSNSIQLEINNRYLGNP